MKPSDLYQVPKTQVQVPELQVRVQVPRSQVQVQVPITLDQVQPKYASMLVGLCYRCPTSSKNNNDSFLQLTGAREPWRRWSLCSPNFIRAHPTFGTTNFFCKQINRQQYKCTTLVLLSVDLFATFFLLYSICICIAVVHFKNVPFKKF